MSSETPWRELVASNPRGIPEGPAAIHFCPVPGCLDIWESEGTCEHSVASDPQGCCSTCAGMGGTSEGPCWDCRATGCAHPEPLCAISAPTTPGATS